MENPLGGMMEWFQGLPSYAQIGIPVAGAAGIFIIAKSKGSGGASGAYVSGPYGSSAGGGGGGSDTTLPTPNSTQTSPPAQLYDPGPISGGGGGNPAGGGLPNSTGSPLPGRRPIHRPLPPTRVYPPNFNPAREQTYPSNTGTRPQATPVSFTPNISRTNAVGAVDSPRFSNTSVASPQQYFHGNTTARRTGVPTPQYFHGNTSAPSVATPQYYHGNTTAPKTPVKQYFHGNPTAPKTVIATQPLNNNHVSAPVTHPLMMATTLRNTVVTSKSAQVTHAKLSATRPVATRKASAAKTYSVAQLKHASLARQAAL